MSRFPEALALLALVAIAAPAAAGDIGLGRPATEAEIAAWDIDVRPDGLGLPPGQGSVAEGEMIFDERCAVCHGDFGEGAGRWPALAGGQGTLTRNRPVKTIGSYWPYLSTVFDYVHRAMPFGDAQSLTADETYAVTAYLLYLNDIVTDDEFVLSPDNFAEVHLPNEGNFVDDPRPDTPTLADGAPCMEDCGGPVEISMRAVVLDVTPDQDGLVVSEDGSVAAPAEQQAEDTEVGQQAATGGERQDNVAQQPSAEEPVTTAVGAHPELIAAGEKVFRKCRTCHQVGEDAKNRVGPQLNGVVGRVAGSVEDFRYSDALATEGEEGLVWTADTLDAYIADPKGYVPGTKMSFPGLKSPEDRAAVAAYLSQFH